MKKILSLLTLIVVLLLPKKSWPIDIDNSPEFIKEIIKLKKSYEKKSDETKNIFLFFADFDGTIINGDISEGSEHYQGLIEQGILAGFSSFYNGPDGYQKFLNRYNIMKYESPLASCFLILFAFMEMTPEKKLEFKKLIKKTFQETLAPYIFQESREIINLLQKEGILVHILSASPQFFVEEAETLGEIGIFEIPKERIWGISLERPIPTYGEGKREQVQLIKKSYEEEGFKVHILGGMGNSYHTDGPFLQEVIKNNGKSLMINGGKTPRDYLNTPLIKLNFVQ